MVIINRVRSSVGSRINYNPDLLTEEQSGAHADLSDRVIIAATAGSGKTFTVVNRCLREIARSGRSKSIFLAFNKAAATKINQDLGIPEPWKNKIQLGGGTTLDKFAYSLACHNFPPVILGGNTMESKSLLETQESLLRRQIAGAYTSPGSDLSRKERREYRREVIDKAQSSINRMISVEALEPQKDERERKYLYPAKELLFRCRDNGYTSHDLIGLTFEYAVQAMEKKGLRKNLYDVEELIVDEAQDLCALQWRMIDTFCDLAECRLTIVGDDNQCQPPGTMVRVPSKEGSKSVKEIPIEKLIISSVAEQGVTSFSIRGSRMVGTTRKSKGSDVSAEERHYSGLMYTIDAEGITTKATPNHKFIVRWVDNKNTNLWATYLMWRKGYGYRAGWCQFFTSSGGSHFSVRANLEKADNLWILKIHHSKSDASLEESFISASYGISTATFKPINNSTIHTERYLKELHKRVDRKRENHVDRELIFREIQLDYGIDLRYPMWPFPTHQTRQKGSKFGQQIFECYSVNLIPELMSIPIPQEDRTVRWVPISNIKSEKYTGLVYSLDVKKYHTYVSDGIVTHNSIYRWRDADPDNFIERAEDPSYSRHYLTENRRCPRNIVRYGTNLVNRITGPSIQKEMRSLSTQQILPRIRYYDDSLSEARGIVDFIVDSERASSFPSPREGYQFRDFLIMARCNSDLADIQRVMFEERVPHVVLGANIFRSYQIKAIIGLLKLIENNDRGEGAESALTWLPGIGNATARRALQSEDVFSGLIDAAYGVGKESSLNLYEDVLDIRGAETLREKAGRARTALFSEDIRKSDGPDSTREVSAAFVRICESFDNIDDLSRYCAQLETAGEDRNGDHVTLSTVHKQKGEESRCVILSHYIDGRWPHYHSQRAGEHALDDERRLGFVAVTRTMEDLIITIPRINIFGRTSEPSSFLNEMGIFDND